MQQLNASSWQTKKEREQRQGKGAVAMAKMVECDALMRKS